MIDPNYENQFSDWAKSPPESEQQRCENAIREVRRAIDSSDALYRRAVRVFVQGSYRNRVNIRSDSDVDIGVVCNDVFLSKYPNGRANEDFGNINSDYTFSQFKRELEEALIDQFGKDAVKRGNKAFKVDENTYRINADVVPLFEFREYWTNGSYRAGVALLPDDGSDRIENYPERLFDYWPTTSLHYENGVSKNRVTSRSFKGIVRILKRLLVLMSDDGFDSANEIPGYLLECLAYNCANSKFTANSWCATVEGVVEEIWQSTYSIDKCGSWTEVDEIRFLFHQSQPWSRTQVQAFVVDLRVYLGLS